MQIAGVADEDGFLLDAMPTLSPSCARVHGMLVVQTATYGISFDNLYTHAGVLSAVLLSFRLVESDVDDRCCLAGLEQLPVGARLQISSSLMDQEPTYL